MSSIYNSDRKIEQFFLGSQEITEMFLGNELVFSKITNNLFYKLHEFVGSLTVQNTIEAPVKSAILKGQTWVNLWNNNGEHKITPNSGIEQTGDCFKKSTKYLLKYNVLRTNSNNAMLIQYYQNSTLIAKEPSYMKLNKDYYILTTPSDDFNVIRIFYSNSYGVETVRLENIMLIEYQEDMENWSIPYFEGMMSVKMPVLTTSNEDGTKTNILTVNEDVTLRSNGNVYDELNLLTGRLTQRIDENNEVLAQEVVKTVDLSSNKVYAYNGTTHYTCSSEEDWLLPTVCIEVPIEEVK